MPRKHDYDDLSIIIGRRIHELRLVMGMSRHELSEKIGVTHQQTHKYEKGIGNITVSRLSMIADVMEKPISYFLGEEVTPPQIPPQHRRMSMEVTRNFMKITEPSHQEAINTLVRALCPNGE